VEENFSKMSSELAQYALRYQPGIEIPDPVCSLEANRSVPKVPESEICSPDYERTAHVPLEPQKYEFEAPIPSILAWWVRHEFEGSPDYVQMKLCDNSGELLPPPSSNALWTISPSGFDSSVSFGGTANFPIRIPAVGTDLAVGQ
jgi:hypothetical protein